MAEQDYAKVFVALNGSTLTKITKADRKTDSGQQPVITLNEGLVGFTPGGGAVSISIGFVIPIGGPELDFQGICARGEYCTMQIGWGSKSYTGIGKILNEDVSQSTGANAEGNFEWHGPLHAVE